MIEPLYQRIAAFYRKRRFALFKSLLDTVPKPYRILDVGGTPRFWQESGFGTDPSIHITLLNVSAYASLPATMESVAGVGQDLSRYADGSFEVVHSNSVLAYVGGQEARKQMAAEVHRVGQRYFVQTPNNRFFLDWRTAIPFFNRLPVQTQASILARIRVGRRGRLPSLQAALDWVHQVDDISLQEFRELFSEAEIVSEKFLGLTKSFVAYSGFESARSASPTTETGVH